MNIDRFQIFYLYTYMIVHAAVLSGKLKKSKSLEQEQLHSVVPTDEGNKSLNFHTPTHPVFHAFHALEPIRPNPLASPSLS